MNELKGDNSKGNPQIEQGLTQKWAVRGLSGCNSLDENGNSTWMGMKEEEMYSLR